MKTVIDAVNQFKGNSRVGNYYYVCNQDSGVVALWGKATLDDLYGPLWSELCTDREFNDLVSQMETNFGKCEQTYGNYKGLYRACKRLELYPLINNKPQPTPIFTQEMADNGVLPSVGMEVMIDGEKRAILMGADKDGDYITMSKGVYQFDSIGYIKPLNPPITLIDGEAYQFEVNGQIIKGCYNKFNTLLYSAHKEYLPNLCTNIQPLTVEVK